VALLGSSPDRRAQDPGINHLWRLAQQVEADETFPGGPDRANFDRDCGPAEGELRLGDLLSNGLRHIDLRDRRRPIEVPHLPFTLHLLPFSPPEFAPPSWAGSLMMNEYPSLIPQGL
jgi:hypothetical protein